MTRRMRVLELTWEYAPAMSGGLGVACAAICEALEAVDPALRLVVAQPVAGGVQRRRPGARPEPLLAEGAYAAPFDAVRLYGDAVEREFAGEPFDAVHAHDWLSFDAALRLQRAGGVPIVAHVHSLAVERDELPHPRIHALERECLQAAAAVIAVGRGTAERARAEFGLAGERVHVVHNGIDLPPGDDAQLLGPPLSQRSMRVSFVGRLMAQKAPERFVALAARLLRTHPALQFSVVGEGELKAGLQAAADAAGIGARLTFHGFLPRPGVDEILRDSRLVVVPSRHEPFGLVALEAVAAGAPVVAARHAGVAEVVPDLALVDAADPQALADACTRLLDDPALAEARRRAALQQVRRRGWADAARSIAGILRRFEPVPQPHRMA